MFSTHSDGDTKLTPIIVTTAGLQMDVSKKVLSFS